MITTLAWLTVRRSAADYERAFVESVATRRPIARNAWVERLLLAGWLVVAAKCLLVIWAIRHWSVPFDPLWVNGPTILMAALVTGLYLCRNRG